ncbi:MAG TPA: DUF1592 domain-containing protein [Candidatus Saccharimonadales bacterium]|nr:DUF1592 domain-containing protein [Candidatus Saccharimonadales bacterium]
MFKFAPPFRLFCGLALLIGISGLAAEKTPVTPQYYDKSIRPILKEYCLKCHSTEKQKGDLDLEQFSSLKEVMKHSEIWQNVAEQLANNEMPPKDKPQPSPANRERLANWVNNALDQMALARAGDPGPVVLRRLSNAEYTYTIRDLTGVDSLDPVKEFPVDGAAGEGFMNTGNALVMSPSLITKYLDAGKNVASHAVLLPDGFRFSPATTRRDWSEELLTQIRSFYRDYTDPRGGDKVNLQGIVFETNEGGRLPVEKYLAASLVLRDSGKISDQAISALARERNLSPKYLKILFNSLSDKSPSELLDRVRRSWRAAKPADLASLTAEIGQWQKVLWKFASVGHIGKAGGPKGWMEPVSPISNKQEVKLKLTAPADGKDLTLYLVAGDAGDGNDHDYVVWQQPRLVAPGKPNILLRDLRDLTQQLAQQRTATFQSTARALAAAAEASKLGAPPAGSSAETQLAELARKNGVEISQLKSWLDYLGIGTSGELKITGHLTKTLAKASAYDFVKGWGVSETPLIVANSSTQHVRIPGNMKAHGIAVHPSPKLQAVVGWQSPIANPMRVAAKVTHAHPECGNGVTWSLEIRRGATRQRLASGNAQGGKEVKIGPFENVAIQKGDLVSLLIGPRGDHSCDLTDVELNLSTTGEGAREWNLNRDVSPDILASNPHADSFGNEGVWHFYTELISGAGEVGPVIPPGSLLAKWQAAPDGDEKQQLGEQVQKLLLSGPPTAKDTPDAALYRQIASLGGPLFARVNLANLNKSKSEAVAAGNQWGLDAKTFGKHPNGGALDSASLCVRAPSVLEVRVPADLAAGYEFVTTGVLDEETGVEGSVQLQVLTTKPSIDSGLLPSQAAVTEAAGAWTSNNRRISHSAPIIVNDGTAAQKRMEAAFEEFRQLFPAALCYTKIVPVDEVVTLTLYYREDHQLARLMLDDAQRAKLDRLWDELHYISGDALTLVDAFEQIWQFATQDADPKVFEPLRKPIQERASAYKKLLVDTQPKHVEAVLKFAERAYRRPLTAAETKELQGLYDKLRAEEMHHEEALRLTLARVFVAPAFLYHLEKAAPGEKSGPVSDWELANRLSYFLWSSVPDAELASLAKAGKLHKPDVLAAQAARMLGDARTRRLATEFGCQWLHIHDFDTLDEKSERHFPTFLKLRGDMYEESIRFFADLFQRNGSVLNILNADYTFLNEALAKHYVIPGVKGPEWRRVDGVSKYGRGGILAQATTLAKQSGASRTSPILRGNWVAEALLGDKLPRPPKDVPRLPDDEAALEGLTVRQLVEKHSSDPRCYGCHRRIDAFGYSLESFDAIGRRREKDLGDRPINTSVKVMDGSEFEGMDGLRNYLINKRGDVFLKQFCRKLLGYSLGRAVQLSDAPLIAEMRDKLKRNDYHIANAIETIVRSRQFREIRGRDGVYED